MFAKAIRRIRPGIQSILNQIEGTELINPTWSTLLVGITDELGPGIVNEISDDDGSLQLMVGFPDLNDWSSANDGIIRTMVLDIIRSTLDRCGLTPADRSTLENCLT